MTREKLVRTSFLNSFAAFIYTAVVAWLMFNGGSIFGNTPSFLIPLFMLTLFILSALITGALLLGKSLQLYFDSSKKEAVSLLFLTAGWLAAYVAIVGVLMLIFR